MLRLDPALPFEELKEAVAEKFRESADFFKDAKVALAFDGRELTEEQEMELLQVIDENTRLKVYCIVDRERLEKRKEDRQDEEELKNIGQFFRGTLRFGQVLESETGIVIIGDVEPGAQVIARGSVVVIGHLKGTVYAQSPEPGEAFVAALYMEPELIRIGMYTRKSRVKRSGGPMRPKMCRVKNDRLCFETIHGTNLLEE